MIDDSFLLFDRFSVMIRLKMPWFTRRRWFVPLLSPATWNKWRIFPAMSSHFTQPLWRCFSNLSTNLRYSIAKDESALKKVRKHNSKSVFFLIQNWFDCSIYSVDGTVWYINTCVWVAEMHLKVLTHPIAHSTAVTLHWNSRSFRVSSLEITVYIKILAVRISPHKIDGNPITNKENNWMFHDCSNHMNWNGASADKVTDLLRMSVLYMELCVAAKARDNIGQSADKTRWDKKNNFKHTWDLSFRECVRNEFLGSKKRFQFNLHWIFFCSILRNFPDKFQRQIIRFDKKILRETVIFFFLQIVWRSNAMPFL